jgi:hypothetical protein
VREEADPLPADDQCGCGDLSAGQAFGGRTGGLR